MSERLSAAIKATRDRLEPAAQDSSFHYTEAPLISAAISLKRIADALGVVADTLRNMDRGG